ncbi:epidermal growth factor receptor substrate 15 homolog [Schistocerca gregaria]|uniref:epidermal growth factor receptor substrate 15 homolog n=1 Tax=Schistocerca gregaria TaxID=7010 RepID=UPI00211EA17B|nr:epidermal growth factor receptor substrate 15 homolog [Schistocerca gregaria]
MSFQKTPGSFIPVDNTWTITEEVKQKSRQYFKSIDVQNSGFIDSNTAKYFFSLSGLTNAEITKIWSIAHISKDQKLDFCKFQVTMALVLAKLSGKEIPDQLPAPLLESINTNNGSSFIGTLPLSNSTEFAEGDSSRNTLLQDVPPISSGPDTNATGTTNRISGASENVNDVAKQLGNVNISPQMNNISGFNDPSSFAGFSQPQPASGQNFPEKLSSSVPTAVDHSAHENAGKDASENLIFAHTTDPKKHVHSSDNTLLTTAAHVPPSRQQIDEGPSRNLQPLDTLPNADSYTITPEQLIIYDWYFKRLDERNMGLVPKEAVRVFSSRLGLPDSIFASVWAIASVNRDVQFSNREFFIVFLHLVNLWRRGYKLPTQLPQQLANTLVMPNVNLYSSRHAKPFDLNYQKSNFEADALEAQKHDAKINSLTHEKDALMQEIRQQSTTNAFKIQKLDQIDQKNYNLKQNAIAIEMQVEFTRSKITNISNSIIEAEGYLLTLTRQVAHINSLLMQKQSQRESERAALSSFHEKLRHMIVSLVKQTEENAQVKVST